MAVEKAIAHVELNADGIPMQESFDITLHFHPDKLCREELVLSRLNVDKQYRSQYETGTSNGGLSAFKGGDRWNWESRIFGGAYDDADIADRPKYGSLNFRGRDIGGSPRFGSCYFVVSKQVHSRTTFCYPDSCFSPTHFSTARKFGELISIATSHTVDLLDDYIEAHIHGSIRIPDDIERLVLDPCYKGTEIESIANSLGCKVDWHSGFIVNVETLRDYVEYRGIEIVQLAEQIALDGVLTPKIIGDAVRSKCYDEQHLKRVWHYLARYGSRFA